MDSEGEDEETDEESQSACIRDLKLLASQYRRPVRMHKRKQSGYNSDTDTSRRYVFPKRRRCFRQKERGYILKKIKRQQEKRKSYRLSLFSSEIPESLCGKPSVAFTPQQSIREKDSVEDVYAVIKLTLEGLSKSPNTSVCSHCSFSLSSIEKTIPLFNPHEKKSLFIAAGFACSPICALSYFYVRKDKRRLWITRLVLKQLFGTDFYGLQPLDNHILKPMNPNGFDPRDPRFIEQYTKKYTHAQNTMFKNVHANRYNAYPKFELYIDFERNDNILKRKQSTLTNFFTK